MKKITILILIMCCILTVFTSANSNTSSFQSLKARFDYNSHENLKSASINPLMKKVTLPTWEYSLMVGGYFTLGTNQGISDGLIDDHCQLSFGHPFALSSYPYFSIDGDKIDPSKHLTNADQTVMLSGDTIRYQTTYNNTVNCETAIYITEKLDLELVFTVTNIDSDIHEIELGLLYDAALGHWGDGFVFQNNEAVLQNTTFENKTIDELNIWERNQTNKGIGNSIRFVQNVPDKTTIANWYDEYYNKTTSMGIYDLAIHCNWNKKEIQPNENYSFKVAFTLLEPNVSNQPFIRCDLPNFMSIENNMLFPSSIASKVEIINNDRNYSNLSINVEQSDYVTKWETEKSFEMDSETKIKYETANIEVPEIYESIVVPVTISLLKSETLIDKITRNVFIPTSPFSNEGLLVNIDSTFINFNKNYLRFSCKKEETEQLIYNLKKNNIFFFENNVRQTDFKLEKDTTGGVNNTDIVFVLDVTGSMSNEIAGVRDNIIEFADSLSIQGIDFRLGMVTFLDKIETIYPFTNDVQAFQGNVAEQFAHGGGDRAENSLEALMTSTQYDFRENANRIVIWITDADYHINNNITSLDINEVTNSLLANGITVFCIGSQEFQTDYYDPIVINTGGTYFNINGNFRDILLEVSHLKQSPNYILSFIPNTQNNPNDKFKIEIHYAGLGGFDEVSNLSKVANLGENIVATAYPNPIDERTLLEIEGEEGFTYHFTAYNSFGIKISELKKVNHTKIMKFNINELIPYPARNSKGIYIIKINAYDLNGMLNQSKSLKIEQQ